ncbi:hypothetical protein ACS0TY_022997 [Phlomoides rotata]
MESHEERLHKLVLQSKINETKDVMKRKASEIDKNKIERNRSEKGGFMSMQSMGSGRMDTGFGSDISLSSNSGGYGSGSGFGLSTNWIPVSPKVCVCSFTSRELEHRANKIIQPCMIGIL